MSLRTCPNHPECPLRLGVGAHGTDSWTSPIPGISFPPTSQWPSFCLELVWGTAHPEDTLWHPQYQVKLLVGGGRAVPFFLGCFGYLLVALHGGKGLPRSRWRKVEQLAEHRTLPSTHCQLEESGEPCELLYVSALSSS